MQIGHGKSGVIVGEYGGPRKATKSLDTKNPGEILAAGGRDTNPILGYVEPACDGAQWILWFMANGDAILHQERAIDGGVRDEPVKIKARLGKPARSAKPVVAAKPVKISCRDIESMLGLLIHDSSRPVTSCTFHGYSLTAELTETGLVINWFKPRTREPIAADGLRA